MNTLDDAFAVVERERKTLEVYAADEEVATELATQFSTRNVDVTHDGNPSRESPGFIVVRDANGEFLGAASIDRVRRLLSPDVHPPWRDDAPDAADVGLFEFLDDTIFTSYDRRQLLATAREIEERAWRTDGGAVHVGFQRAAAFSDQIPVYNRFARDSGVSVWVYIEDEWEGDLARTIETIANGGDEIGRFWFVLFDGGETTLNACGLLAEEREPDAYYGFWTYDSEFVDELISYLESTYGRG